MEHHRIPTHHLYDVPREAAQHICQLSELCYQYGPRTWGYTKCTLADYARQHLGLHVQQDDQRSLWEHEAALEEAILDRIAQQGQHRIYVLQYRGHPEQGWMCLIPDRHTEALQQVLNTFCLAMH